MYYLIYGCLGVLSGLVFYFLAIHHVKVRSEYDNGAKLKMLKNKKFILVWILASLFLFFVVAAGWTKEWTWVDYWNGIRVLLFAMLAFNVSAVDIMLRRIPNAILLGMILLQILHMTISIYGKVETVSIVKQSFVGLLLAYIVFLFPAIFRLSVGAGDVKYSAAIGFMLGFYNYVEAMAVMAATLVLFYIYLKITKTGNMKTAAPMAPFLSVGTFIALLFPIA